MTPDIGFAMMTDIHESTVFRVELPDSVVPGYAAVLTEGHDNLVL